MSSSCPERLHWTREDILELFDTVSHKNGWIGRVRKITLLDGKETIDVEVDNEFHDIVYDSPAENWRVIAKNEEGPLYTKTTIEKEKNK